MAMNQQVAFRPLLNSTISISGNTSAAVAVPNANTTGSYQVRVRNKSATIDAYCAFGNSTVAVTVPAGAAGNTPGAIGFSVSSSDVITVNGEFVSVIGVGGTANVEITTGYGKK
jgi:hypothetical protein